MRKVLIYLATAVAVAFAGFIGRQVANIAVPSPRTLEESLPEVVKKMNAQMPMSVDKNTRMDSVTLPAPHVIQYNYTLNNISTPLPGEFARNEPLVRETIIKLACSTPKATRLLNQGVTNVYAYHTTDGSFFGSIAVTKSDCQRWGGGGNAGPISRDRERPR
jgi:hypothetical protein